MGAFEKNYKLLNAEQKLAVDSLEGPLLVVAGPGTGKTQLLSMRVANLLRQPDVLPSNILCITFTDNAARNMRERLETIIGQAAFHVSIQTFHSFGADVINQYPDYFLKRQLLQPVDQLGSYEILRKLFGDLSHDNPLSTKVGDDYIYISDVLSTISWLKQNALSPDELQTLLEQNNHFMLAINQKLGEVFSQTPSPKLIDDYRKLAETMTAHVSDDLYSFTNYGRQCASELLEAIDTSPKTGRYVPAITAWRNKWCEKDGEGNHVLKDSGRAHKKMMALCNIYRSFQSAMSERGLYDFADMIMETVHALENNHELALNLQERYQYVLIDEFQDTNKAQMRIIKALGDNPVNEQRPNIMAVGDDDQAIYAFQGAESSNMLDFVLAYRDVTLVTLTQNYRSTDSILGASHKVVSQAANRLEDSLSTINKELVANAKHSVDTMEHIALPSELQQYQWIAHKIKECIKKGIRPQDIAVIAPRHRYLERLMPYVGALSIPVAYERRENILDAPIVHQLITMSELTHALAEGNHTAADILLSEVLSYPFWEISLEDLAKLSLECYQKRLHWIECLLNHQNKQFKAIAKWFLKGAQESHLQPIEYMLDRLIGNTELVIDQSENGEPIPVQLTDNDTFHSPLRSYYFSQKSFNDNTDQYLALLGHLSTLRHHLRNWQPDRMIKNADFVEFVRLHRQAKLKIIDTNPHTQTTNAVQVMTVYKAKGLEFDAVFVINAQDEVWGVGARGKSDRIRLPKNLPIKPAGDSVDDKLRLLYVALTRSRHTLYITSYTHDLDNKLSHALSFIGNNQDAAQTIHAKFTPQLQQKVTSVEAVEVLSTDWAYKFRDIIADKPTLLEPILKNYKLSATHLNNFLDVVNAGPEYFLVHNLLRFPQAMTPHAAYGDAVHRTLQWIYAELRTNNKLPSTKAIVGYFDDNLERKHLSNQDFKLFAQRGSEALTKYLAARNLEHGAIIERGFHNEGALVGEALLTGKIDKMIIDGDTIHVTDFKTGSPATSWKGKYDYEQIKLHKYQQQLMFYKLLIEHSASYTKKYQVVEGSLDFVESDDRGEIAPLLTIRFNHESLQRFEKLIQSVWSRIQDLSFPSVEAYSKDYKGVLAFEQDLIDGKK